MPGDDLLVRHRQHHVGAAAVLELEQLVDLVAAGAPPRLGRVQHRHQHLLAADRVHLLAHDLHDPLVHPPARRAATTTAPSRPGGSARRAPSACARSPRRRRAARVRWAGSSWTDGSWPEREAYPRPESRALPQSTSDRSAITRKKSHAKEPPHGLLSTAAPLRLQRAGAAHRRGDDARASRQAPSGVRRQGQRRARGHRVGRQADRGGASRTSRSIPEDKRGPVRNNGGGHYNHSLFWEWMSPDGGGEPDGELRSRDRLGVRLV